MSHAAQATAPNRAPAPGRAATPNRAARRQAAGSRPVAQGLRESLRTTPGRLRVAAVIVVLAALAFGVVGLQICLGQAAHLADAQRYGTQMVELQNTRNDLISADATAANTYLVGGLETTEQRTAYTDRIDAAATRIPALAATSAPDAPALGAANADLTTYTGLIEQARANNRQGFPVGAAYLDEASALMRGTISPDLESLARTNAEHVDADLSATAGGNVIWLIALAVVVLVWVQIWLARRTHRYLNIPLVIATLGVIVAGVAGQLVLGAGGDAAQEVRSGSFQAAQEVSTAISKATDARALESLTLIKRGSGASLEADAKQAADDAAAALSRAADLRPGAAGLSNTLSTWRDEHTKIRALDDDNDWDGAVALATSAEDGSPQVVFAQFVQGAEDQLAKAESDAWNRLDSARLTATVLGWFLLAAGVLVAAVGVVGINRRLEEYR